MEHVPTGNLLEIQALGLSLDLYGARNSVSASQQSAPTSPLGESDVACWGVGVISNNFTKKCDPLAFLF